MFSLIFKTIFHFFNSEIIDFLFLKILGFIKSYFKFTQKNLKIYHRQDMESILLNFQDFLLLYLNNMAILKQYFLKIFEIKLIDYL